MVEYALQSILLHMTWLFKRFSEANAEEETKKMALSEKRDRAVEIFQKLALKEQTNAAEVVRRQVSPR